MSHRASGGKLQRMTFTPHERDVELFVRFSPRTDPPTGSVRDHNGVEQPFNGWLGLLRLLEDNCPAPPPRRGDNHKEQVMNTTDTQRAPIALAPEGGEARWFLGSLVTIKSSAETTGGVVAVTENLSPRGGGSPLHVHHNEDEWFYVIEGELTLWVGGQVIVAPGGAFVYGPRDIPHTFTVTSDQARFLLVTEPAGFENFVRELSEPAARLEIPPAPTEPPDMEAMLRVAAEYGLEILGPPGIPA